MSEKPKDENEYIASKEESLFKRNWNSVYFRWGLTSFTVIAAGILFYYVIFHGTNIKQNVVSFFRILMPIVFGFVLAYLMSPVLNYLEYRILFPLADKMKIRKSVKRKSLIRAIGIFFTAFLFFVLFYSIIYMLLSQIVPSILNIISNFDTYIDNMTNWIRKVFEDNPTLVENVTDLINRYSDQLDQWLNETVLTRTTSLIKTVSLSVLSGLKILWNFLIGFIISIYVLASKEKFAAQAKKAAYALFPQARANRLIHNFRFTHKTFSGFFGGKVLDSIIIGLLCFLGTTFLKTPYAALVSFVIGITNIIPFFGPYIGGIPCALLVLLVDPVHPLNCVYFVIFLIILQQFDGNILGPKILGDSTGLAGFWIIFSITLFGGFFGVVGMVVGVPIFAVIYTAARALINQSLEGKNMPQDTELYMNVGYVDNDGFHEYIPRYMRKNKKKNKKNVPEESRKQS